MKKVVKKHYKLVIFIQQTYAESFDKLNTEYAQIVDYYNSISDDILVMSYYGAYKEDYGIHPRCPLTRGSFYNKSFFIENNNIIVNCRDTKDRRVEEGFLIDDRDLKQVIAMQALVEHCTFDYVFLTSPIYFIDIPKVLRKIKKLPKTKVYSGSLCYQYGYLFIGDGALLISSDVVNYLVKNKNKYQTMRDQSHWFDRSLPENKIQELQKELHYFPHDLKLGVFLLYKTRYVPEEFALQQRFSFSEIYFDNKDECEIIESLDFIAYRISYRDPSMFTFFIDYVKKTYNYCNLKN